MKSSIIIGSHRPISQSQKVGTFVSTLLNKLFPKSTQFTLDLGKTPLPLWDEGVWNNEAKWLQAFSQISRELLESEAIVVISPEWSGMVPAALKNFFLLCSKNELRHKPGLIVSVSAGLNGVYPVAELRMSSYKNTGICYIPDHVIVRNVEQVLNDPQKENSTDDSFIRHRLEYSLKILHEYGKALRQVRESGVVDVKNFPFGM